MTEALQIVGDIATMRLQPGDVIVVRVESHLTSSQSVMLRDHVNAHFPGFKVLVLDAGMELQVARRHEPGADSKASMDAELGGL